MYLTDALNIVIDQRAAIAMLVLGYLRSSISKSVGGRRVRCG